MSDFLQSMATLSAERAAATGNISAAELDKVVVPLRLGVFDVIAEIKDRSPAEGELATENVDRSQRARDYASGGAAAISVLTEPSRFDGSLDHLRDVVAAVPNTPVMRKDFLVDPVQILEARAAGASGVLLIATMLNDAQIRSMLDCAAEHELFVLLESFDEQDLLRAARLLDNSADQQRAEQWAAAVWCQHSRSSNAACRPGAPSEIWRLRFRQAVALPRVVCTTRRMLLPWQDSDINWRWSVQR